METLHEDLHPFLDASLAQLAKHLSEQKNARTKFVQMNETHTFSILFPQVLRLSTFLNKRDLYAVSSHNSTTNGLWSDFDEI
jgi:hypothetical protein